MNHVFSESQTQRRPVSHSTRHGRRAALVFVCLATSGLGTFAWAGPLSDVAPPGPHFKLSAKDHEACSSTKFGEPLVGTTYFYWYDVYSGEHIIQPDGRSALTTRLPEGMLADLSYKSLRWHQYQLADMIEGFIDFLMPVYWGTPGDYESWSVVGLKKLMEAHARVSESLKDNVLGYRAPRIGMFYDTSTLKWNPRSKDPIDLTTDAGKEWFYVCIRDFWSLVPPCAWARVDGKPIVFLYGASFAAAVDDTLFDDARRRFKADFGVDLFLVRHNDWPGQADAWYTWGGALGLKLGDHVAALGPGYDDRQVRSPGTFVDRERGEFYDRQWIQLLRMSPADRPWLVHIETWNEWHEGTDIARSMDANNLYIRATHKFSGAFHNGGRLTASGRYAGAEQVRWTAEVVDGLAPRPSGGDGCWRKTTTLEGPAIVTMPCDPPLGPHYLYFDIDDAFIFAESGLSAEVTIQFSDDHGCDRFWIEYDSSKRIGEPYGGAFKPGDAVALTQTGTLRSVTQRLDDVFFCNRTNAADFRLVADGGAGELTVREVVVRSLPRAQPSPATQTAPAP